MFDNRSVPLWYSSASRRSVEGVNSAVRTIGTLPQPAAWGREQYIKKGENWS